MQGVPYSEAISSMLWPVVVSRPDATYTVGILSQYIQNPGPAHWEGLKRVINYLGSTKNLWLTFGGQKETLVEGVLRCRLGRTKTSALDIRVFVPFRSWHHILEFKKAACDHSLEHRGQVHHANPCN